MIIIIIWISINVFKRNRNSSTWWCGKTSMWSSWMWYVSVWSRSVCCDTCHIYLSRISVVVASCDQMWFNSIQSLGIRKPSMLLKCWSQTCEAAYVDNKRQHFMDRRLHFMDRRLNSMDNWVSHVSENGWKRAWEDALGLRWIWVCLVDLRMLNFIRS